MKNIFLLTIFLGAMNTTYSQNALTNESITIEMDALYNNLQFVIGEANANLYKCDKQHIVKKQIASVQRILQEKYTAIEDLKEKNSQAYAIYTQYLSRAKEIILRYEKDATLANDLCNMIKTSEAIQSENDVKNICELYNEYKIVAGTYDHYETQIKTNYNGILNAKKNGSCCECFESLFWFINSADEACGHMQEKVSSLNKKFNKLPKNQQEITVSGTTEALFDTYKGFITSNPNDPYGKPLSTSSIREKIVELKSILNCNNEHPVKKTYYKNGNIETVGAELNGSRTGTWKIYHENGNLYQEVIYIDDRKVGQSATYTKSGQLEATLVYVAGSIQESMTFYENGNPKIVSKVEGTFTQVQTGYENGQLKSKGLEQGGLKFKEWQQYHENGKLESKGVYKFSLKEGVWTFYDKNGALITTEIYLDGVKQ